MSQLHPVHFSLAGKSRRPSLMDGIDLDRALIETMERVALEIFTDMSNVGQPFPKAIAAIYLSGMQNAIAARADGPKGHGTAPQSNGPTNNGPRRADVRSHVDVGRF